MRKALLVCGILSSLLYAAILVFGPTLWEGGYNSSSQTVSELFAIGAPSRPILVPLGIAYDLLLIAFGVGVWGCAGRRRGLRVTAGLLVVVGAIGSFWPPMHLRGVEATLTDTMHIVFAALLVPSMLLAVAFGAAAFGTRFRIYSIATIAILFAAGALTALDGPRVAANLPTPWVGFWERVNIVAYDLWIVVLATALFRAERPRTGAGRAAPDERSVLAGDELLPAARAQVTHHVDIEAPPEKVWPWLLQMGRRRGGWYSWDLLDNGGVASADRIIPALQKLAVGDILPVKPTGTDGFAVLVLEPARALVLGDPSLLPGTSRPGSGAPRATWAFSLEPIGEAATHLVVRVRAEYEPSLSMALLRPIVGGLHEVMERKQLRTIKQRAENS